MGVGDKRCGWKEPLAVIIVSLAIASGIAPAYGEGPAPTGKASSTTAVRAADIPKASPSRNGDVKTVAAADRNTSSSRPSKAAPAVRQPDQPESDDHVTFTIKDFFVQGNNLLPPERIDSLLEPFIGKSRRFNDIEKARATLEQAYRELGYPTIAVTVPEQTVEFGIITLTVTEGRLKTIDVTDNWWFSSAYIKNKLPAVKPGALLHEPTVLKQLDTLNANPDLKVVPVLKTSDNPEQLNLELKAKDRPPLHGKVELNNRGVPTTPRLRLNAAVQYTNLFDADHAITLQTSQTPQDWGAVEVYSGNYYIPFGASEHQLVFYGATARSRAQLDSSPIPTGGGLDIIGNSTIAGFRYQFPLGMTGSLRHQLSVGVDYKHLGRSNAELPGTGISVTATNPLTYTPASLGYTGLARDEQGYTKLTATTRGYIAGIMPEGDKDHFAGDPNDPLETPGFRKGSSGSFIVVQGGIERYQVLPGDFGLTAKADGQWVNEPVVPTEQYFAGGMESVRGYREFEAVGDNAAHATIEAVSPALNKLPLEHVSRSLRFVAFYDTAYLWIRQPVPGQVGHWYLQGTGVGFRLTVSDYLRFRYDAAWTLNSGPFTPAGSYYGHFSLEAVF
ncbi:conserved exported protein of unknown function [Nitrospira sp. KM1]|nr:conserved exported protein of unknown function [Nitrospira sp. KM1]